MRSNIDISVDAAVACSAAHCVGLCRSYEQCNGEGGDVARCRVGLFYPSIARRALVARACVQTTASRLYYGSTGPGAVVYGFNRQTYGDDLPPRE